MLYAFFLLNLVAGVAIFALPAEWKKAPRRIALAAATVSLVLSVIVFAIYDREAGGYQLETPPQAGICANMGGDDRTAVVTILRRCG